MDNAINAFDILSEFGRTLYSFWWLILPFLFWHIFQVVWLDYVYVYSAKSWRAKDNWKMLEVIPPRDIERGPKPMEIFYTGLTGVISGINTFDQWISGKLRQDPFSVELVGEEGKVHYYIRTLKQHRNMVEAQIYAQYPEAQILEVEDYTKKFPKVIPNRDWDLWGTDFKFTASDPYYPIRTYEQFEESITGEMIDPMAALVETLGVLGPGQHIWLQYMMVPFDEPKSIEGGKALLDKLKGRAAAKTEGSIFGDFWDVLSNVPKGLYSEFFGEVAFKTAAAKKEEQPLDTRLSPVEREVLKAVEENLGRNFFKTKMRMIYLGKRENFSRPNVGTFIGAIKQFNDLHMNQVIPEDISKTYGKIFFVDKIANYRKRKIYDRYRSRNMDGVNLMFSTREMATLFHFPNITVKSHAITQTTSKLGVAPPNLPV